MSYVVVNTFALLPLQFSSMILALATICLLTRSLAAVWHPCTQMKQHETLPLVPIARGEGAWLYDFDGRRYLDAISSWWVNLFGHAQPAHQRRAARRSSTSSST